MSSRLLAVSFTYKNEYGASMAYWYNFSNVFLPYKALNSSKDDSKSFMISESVYKELRGACADNRVNGNELLCGNDGANH